MKKLYLLLSLFACTTAHAMQKTQFERLEELIGVYTEFSDTNFLKEQINEIEKEKPLSAQLMIDAVECALNFSSYRGHGELALAQYLITLWFDRIDLNLSASSHKETILFLVLSSCLYSPGERKKYEKLYEYLIKECAYKIDVNQPAGHYALTPLMLGVEYYISSYDATHCRTVLCEFIKQFHAHIDYNHTCDPDYTRSNGLPERCDALAMCTFTGHDAFYNTRNKRECRMLLRTYFPELALRLTTPGHEKTHDCHFRFIAQ